MKVFKHWELVPLIIPSYKIKYRVRTLNSIMDVALGMNTKRSSYKSEKVLIPAIKMAEVSSRVIYLCGLRTEFKDQRDY